MDFPAVPFSNVFVDIVRPSYNASTGATGGTNQAVIALKQRARITNLTQTDWLSIPPDIAAAAETARRKLYKLRLPSGFDVAEGDQIQNIILLNEQQYWPSMDFLADGAPTFVTAKVRFVAESDPGPLGSRTVYIDASITGGKTSPLK